MTKLQSYALGEWVTGTGKPTELFHAVTGAKVAEATSEGVDIYQCSGAVVDSPAGNVVITAGHCVVDPETGAAARSVVFVPGYREGREPYGSFAATRWVTTPEWEASAGTSDPDEAGDLAMLLVAPGSAGGGSSTVRSIISRTASSPGQHRSLSASRKACPSSGPRPTTRPSCHGPGRIPTSPS